MDDSCSMSTYCRVMNSITSIIRLGIFAVLAFLYFVGSLIVNLLQLLNYIAFERYFPWLRRNINYYLQDVILNQVTLLLEYYCGVRYRMFFADEESKRQFGREPSLALGNHRFQIDAIFYWVCCEMTNILGSAKAYAKYELRLLPILGWTMWFGEFIFLRRSWREDENNIGPAIDNLMKYPFPTTVLLLPEGTRYTKEKFDAGQTYIKEKKLSVQLKDHLLPRVKGFEKTLRTYQENYHGKFGVFNIQLISRSLNEPNVYEPTVKNFLRGKPFKVDCYIERIPNGDLPLANDPIEKYQDFLFKVFERKDELMEIHRQYSAFPKAIKIVKKKSTWRLIRFILLNIVFTGSLLAYIAHLVHVSQSPVLLFAVYGFVFSVLVAGFFLIKLLGNSKYGTKKSKNRNTAELNNNNNDIKAKQQ